MTDRPHHGIDTLLGRVTMSALRRRSREREEPGEASPPPSPRLSASKQGPPRWRRLVLQPLALVFLGLGTLTTLSLVFAATRLRDDGSLSALDWFRLTIVAIIAIAFFGRILAALGRLPPIRQIRRAVKRPAEPRALATIIQVDVDQLAFDDTAFGRMTQAEWARVKTQMRLDDAFWLAVNLALMIFGGIALYGLASSAVREIIEGEATWWSYLRVAMAGVTIFGLVRLLRGSIAQLRLRRQRRRKQAVRRLLRYLLWWDRPSDAAPKRPGSARYAIVGMSPFLIVTCIAVTAAAYSPWGDAADPALESASLASTENDAPGSGGASASFDSSAERAPSDEQTSSISPASASALTTNPTDTGSTSVPPTTDPEDSLPTTSAAADTATSAAPDTSATPDTSEAPDTSPTTTTPTANPTTPTGNPTTPTGNPTTPTANPTTTIVVTTPTTTPTVTPTTTTPTATPTTTTPTATPTTTIVVTTTTAPPTTTTTTVAPAPLMSVDFITNGFFCNGGTAARSVGWSVSGDPAGRVNVFRLQNGGSFVQIGFSVAFSGSIADNPPGTGQYQYWVIAQNSDGVDTVAKTPSGSFFTFTAGSCVD